MATFSFQQVDVLASRPLNGNPLAVVIGADEISAPDHGNASQLDQSERDDVPVASDERRA